MRSPRHARKFFDSVVTVYDGDECLLWPFANIRGYAAIRIEGRTEYVCRVLAGAKPEGAEVVAHSCGNGARGCVARKHIRWTTQKDNIADTLKHGTRNRGTRNGRAVLTEKEVLEVKRLLTSTTLTRAAIGERFGVSREAVNDIAWRKNWGWLDDLQETP